MNIKELKPQANGRYSQGYIDPTSCKKLFPSLRRDRIIYRSSYEKRFIYYCEHNKSIKYWGSECMTIPYVLLTDGSQHTYNPDFVVEMTDGTKCIIEIKPKSQCFRPINESGWLWNAYVHNVSKWNAAKQFCESRGLVFKILTEDTISKL